LPPDEEAVVYKRILVALNGTSQAEKILPHALEIARCSGATVVVFHALEKRAEVLQGAFESGAIGAPPPTAIADRKVVEEASRTDAYFEIVRSDLEKAGVPCEFLVLEGEPTKTLKTIVEEQRIDLVAMTTSGRSSWSKLFVASKADSVLHDVSVPVLLLRVEK
jgi:nucleotide-binding universal stress UspA family protein